MTDIYAEFLAIARRVAELPKPVSYIVLDHACPASGWSDDEDAYGRRYVRCSPSVLDELRHERGGPVRGLAALTGIPVHRREHLYDGWPDRKRDD